MPELTGPFAHLPAVLDDGDIGFLKEACKRHLREEAMPCYALIDRLDSPTVLKIKRAVEACLGSPVHYLNDFYIFTDGSFRTGWHMDTELFTFDRAVNAWILLSPDEVDDPLGFIDQLNDAPERSYHAAEVEGDRCLFVDHLEGRETTLSLREIEATQIHTPRIALGDLLLIDPRRFHRTNADSPKHAVSIKFVSEGAAGFLSPAQVPAPFWPEVDLFNDLVGRASDWDGVIEGIRRALEDESGRATLSAGFYPAKFELYRRMAQLL